MTALASDYGSETNTFNGMLLNVSARPRNGLVFQGGVSTGQDEHGLLRGESAAAGGAEHCPPALTGLTDPTATRRPAWITRYTGLGSYTLPKVDVLISGTFRSDQGAPLAANWAASNAVIQPSLGRPLSNAATSATINLIEPGTLFGDRVNEVDVRLAKILKFGRTRTNIGFDIYNILNSAAVLSYNQKFSPAIRGWRGRRVVGPTGMLRRGSWKFSVPMDF